MKLLLDTHILLWSLENNSLLKQQHKNLLQDSRYEKWISFFSFMEIAIKVNIGKLKLNTSLEELIRITGQNGFNILPVKEIHINKFVSLPLFEEHKDPFDRFIIASAIVEEMSILTVDKKFDLYSSIVKIHPV